MRQWHVMMTFEGYTTGATSRDAIAEFKSLLGLAPAAMRSEIRMTGLRVAEVYEAAENPDPTSSQ